MNYSFDQWLGTRLQTRGVVESRDELWFREITFRDFSSIIGSEIEVRKVEKLQPC